MGFVIDIPDDFLSGILATDFEGIVTEAAEAVTPALQDSMRQHMRKSVGHSGDSELVNSVKATKLKRTKNGAYIVNVGPTGKSKTYIDDGAKRVRSEPVSNALKAIWLEYGTTKQSMRPWLDAATNSVREKILSQMQQVYDKKTGASK